MLIVALVSFLIIFALVALLIKQTKATNEATSEAEKWRKSALRSEDQNQSLHADLGEITHRHQLQASSHRRFAATAFRAVQHQVRLRADMGEYRARAKIAEGQLFDAEQKIVDLAARPQVVTEKLVNSHANNVVSLWRLEQMRSERLWRANVSINPVSDVSPFTADADLVKLCIETEAASLREEVGADTTIAWDAKVVTDPGQAHLMVRVAQELLAVAAKTPSVAKTLRISDTPDLAMFLENETDVDIDLTKDSLSSDLLASCETGGLRVSVKA